MKTAIRLFTSSAIVALLLSLCSCSDEVSKENTALLAQVDAATKTKTSLEIQLAKNSLELEASKERLSESKKREEELSLKVLAQQEEVGRLKTELSAIKERFGSLVKNVENAKNQMEVLIAKQTAERNKPVVDFQASVTFNSGDTKPIANTRFYVLNRSLGSLVLATGAKSFMDTEAGSYRGMAYFFTGTDHRSENMGELKAAISKAMVASFTTNMNGAAAPEIEPGEYWIFGAAEIAKNVILWDYKVSIVGGTNQVYLTPANAAYPY